MATAVLLIALSAKLQIPFWPVPMTLQSLAVLLAGLCLGPCLGGLAVAAYLLAGAAGLPVFAGTRSGLAVLTGPTGGYLAGFLLAVLLVGALAERGWGRRPGRIAAAMLLGHVAILLPGAAWLTRLLGPHTAWASGLAPFWVGTLVKTALGVVLMRLAWRALEGPPAGRAI